MGKEIHTGRMITEYLRSKNLVRTKVAQSMGIPSTAIYAYEQRPSTQVANLARFCHALKYNFFQDLANMLPEEYAKGQFAESPQQDVIAQQAEEIRKLQWENQLMRELLSKK